MNDHKPEPSQFASISRALAQGSAIGLQAGCLGAGVVIGGLLLGLWLDGQLHTRPWLTLGALAVSAVLSVYAIYRFALRAAQVVQAGERFSKEDKPPS